MSISHLIESAFKESLVAQKELQTKWIATLGRLAGYENVQDGGITSLGLLRYQSDYRFDLVLRMLESDTVATLTGQQQSSQVDLIADIQMALSRYWLLSTYEFLRVTSKTSKGRMDEKLTALFRRFELVRVPITKLQIAKDNVLKEPLQLKILGEGADAPSVPYEAKQKTEYHPPMFIDTTTGSFGWSTIDAGSRSNISETRRGLSDTLLNFFD